MYKKITYDEFLDTYKPITNKTTNNVTFETYGDDLAFVLSQPDDTIWTELEGDEGIYIVNGYHFVNRLNYYITEVKLPIDKSVEVVIQLDRETEDGIVSFYPDHRLDLVEIYGEQANEQI
jgi:hypothetical protein